MRTRVLYIAGYGRSGSTVLDRAIGRHDGYVSLGEAWKFWSHVAFADQNCGCGVRFSACETWQRVREVDPSLFDREQGERFFRLHEAQLRTVRMPRLLSARGRAGLMAGFGPEYHDALGRLYRAIGVAHGGAVLVDSSKNPAYCFLLSQVEGVEVVVAHLVRDPRAVAHSWTRTRRDPGSTEVKMMYRDSPAKSAVFWDVWNQTMPVAARAAGAPLVRVQYDDVVLRLGDVVESLTTLAGRAVGGGDDDGAVELGVDHTVSGNPRRFDTGRVPLRLDDEWTRVMRPGARLAVDVLCAPLLHRYGYPFRIRTTGDSPSGAAAPVGG